MVHHISYDTFGNVTGHTAAVDHLFGYTGKLSDPATGLQNNLHRWYDAEVGRWVSEDPIGFAAGDANLARYGGNGPANDVDPSGLVVETVWDGVNVGVGVGSLGYNLWNGNWGMLVGMLVAWLWTVQHFSCRSFLVAFQRHLN